MTEDNDGKWKIEDLDFGRWILHVENQDTIAIIYSLFLYVICCIAFLFSCLAEAYSSLLFQFSTLK